MLEDCLRVNLKFLQKEQIGLRICQISKLFWIQFMTEFGWTTEKLIKN